jgi:hypothetical protein
MKIYYATEKEAQAAADTAHAYLIANDVGYAKSVKAGLTKRWSVPEFDGKQWFILAEAKVASEFPAVDFTAVTE